MSYSPYMLYQTIEPGPDASPSPMLAVGPTVTEIGKLRFSDTGLIRHLAAGRLEETDAGFTWTPATGPAWEFKAITLEAFDRDWRSDITATGWIPAFETNEELWEYYSVHFGHGFWQ